MSASEPPNPVTAGHAAPQWAELARLAGDRAAMLFEDLRRQVGAIAGLVEELHYDDAERCWMLSYRLGNSVLFTAHILAAALEATVTLDAPQHDRLLGRGKLGSVIKRPIREAQEADGWFSVRVRLKTRAAVRAFATLIMRKARLIEGGG